MSSQLKENNNNMSPLWMFCYNNVYFDFSLVLFFADSAVNDLAELNLDVDSL